MKRRLFHLSVGSRNGTGARWRPLLVEGLPGSDGGPLAGHRVPGQAAAFRAGGVPQAGPRRRDHGRRRELLHPHGDRAARWKRRSFKGRAQRRPGRQIVDRADLDDSSGQSMGGGGRRAGSRASNGRKHHTNHHIHLVKVGGGISATFSTPSGRSLQHSHAAALRAPAPCPEHILTLPLFISQAASGRVASAERWRRRWHGSGAPRRPRTHIHSHFITHTHTHNSHSHIQPSQ